MAIYKHGAFVEDSWRAIVEGEGAPAAGGVIFPLDWWKAERQAFDGSHVKLGLRLAPNTRLEEIAQDIPRLALIVLEFPKFGDGRAFSQASLLRERHGYKGELRAVGEVLIDQIQPMLRCGVDAFEITDAATEQALREGRIPGVAHFYQSGIGDEGRAGARPWIRATTR